MPSNVRKPMSRTFLLTLGAVALGVSASCVAMAQVEGPVAPPPKFEVKRLPTKPNPGAPPVPTDEIIRQFTQHEDQIKRAFDSYSFEQTVRVQELGDNGPVGEFSVTGQFYTKPDGERYERIIKPPSTTLRRTAFSLEDVHQLARLPLFALTTDEVPNYTLTYEGQEKLDELNTYIFLAKPKRVERNRLRFDGVVWVDDHDFAIVKSYGQFVTDLAGEATKLPFTIFETYRENFQQKYWFPTYIRSDDIETPEKSPELHLRLVVRSTNFQPPSVPGVGAQPAKPNPSPQ